jgi:hypothetical protein
MSPSLGHDDEGRWREGCMSAGTRAQRNLFVDSK